MFSRTPPPAPDRVLAATGLSVLAVGAFLLLVLVLSLAQNPTATCRCPFAYLPLVPELTFATALVGIGGGFLARARPVGSGRPLTERGTRAPPPG